MHRAPSNPNRFIACAGTRRTGTLCTATRCAITVGAMLSGLLSACTQEAPAEDGPILPPAEADVAASQKARLSAMSASAAEIDQLTRDNAAFAVDMYHALRTDSPGNLFFSPHSISLAFAMLYAGAEGDTEAQMRETMHYTTAEPSLHHAFNALDLALASRNREGVRLRVVNAAWGDRGYLFLPEYLDTLAENYGAGMYLLDIAEDAEGARGVVNQWVADNTAGRIEELMPAGTINAATRLVLTNAVYFKGQWKEEFDPASTRSEPFHRLDGTDVAVDLMTQEESLGYLQGDGWAAVEMPYAGDALSLVAVVPDDLAAFEAALSAELLIDITRGVSPATVRVWFPRLSYGSKASLRAVLEGMGMTDAFSAGTADLSGIDGTRNLFVQAAIHEANIDVNEEGTEAAAATGISAGPTSVPVVQEVRADRPFVYAIIDRQTGAILFLGRVLDPTAT
jgi:serpin B